MAFRLCFLGSQGWADDGGEASKDSVPEESQRGHGRERTWGLGDDHLEEGAPRAFETPMSLRHTQTPLPRRQNPSPLSEPCTPSLPTQTNVPDGTVAQNTEHGPGTDG